MAGIIRKIREMPFKDKVQLIVASLLTIAVMASFPTLAWFNHQRQIAELQKVKTPDLLYISAACGEDVKGFDLSSIDIGDEEGDPTSQLFPFAVAGEYVTSFTLQFSHTTNNPFVYKLYEGTIITDSKGNVCKDKASAQAAVDGSVDFDTDVVEYDVKAAWSLIENLERESLSAGDTIYIRKGNCLLDGSQSITSESFDATKFYLNAQAYTDGNGVDRLIATDKYKADCYGTYSNFNRYASPLYWQKSNIQSVADPSGWGAKPFFKTFILEISWDRDEISNKETDILYFSAYRE